MSVFDRDIGSWEHLARTDPLWAVLSTEEFRGGTLTPEAEARFWASGQQHVDHVLAIIEGELDPGFAPSVSLDFGCGVGRNLIPLAGRSGWAIGLDASPTMVARATGRAADCRAGNVEALVVGRTIDAEAVRRHGRVDFIHSVLVFQHIVAADGLALFDQLLELLDHGGHGFVQFQARNPGGELDRGLRALRFGHGWFNAVATKSRIRRLADLVMLYEYDPIDLLRHLAAHAVSDVVVERVPSGPDGYELRLYFTKFDGSDEAFAQAGRPMKVRVRP
ncbi:MAG: class I SAM-dependent methyltransferase [Acidimicrobiales bacterium]